MHNFPPDGGCSGGTIVSVSVVKGLYDGVRGKLVEMLSHTMMRVKADGGCKLPCEAILGLLYDCEYLFSYCYFKLSIVFIVGFVLRDNIWIKRERQKYSIEEINNLVIYCDTSLSYVYSSIVSSGIFG